MRFAVVAHRLSETNTALAAAAGALVLTPRQALAALEPGDVALARLDVRESLDGVEPGIDDVERLAARGVRVLNPRARYSPHTTSSSPRAPSASRRCRIRGRCSSGSTCRRRASSSRS